MDAATKIELLRAMLLLTVLALVPLVLATLLRSRVRVPPDRTASRRRSDPRLH